MASHPEARGLQGAPLPSLRFPDPFQSVYVCVRVCVCVCVCVASPFVDVVV